MDAPLVSPQIEYCHPWLKNPSTTTVSPHSRHPQKPWKSRGWGGVKEYLSKIRLLAGLLTNNHYKNAHELEDPAEHSCNIQCESALVRLTADWKSSLCLQIFYFTLNGLRILRRILFLPSLGTCSKARACYIGGDCLY